VASLNPIADSYISEALATYGAACYKATAVMVGCAAESLVLELRDAIFPELARLARQLIDWVTQQMPQSATS